MKKIRFLIILAVLFLMNNCVTTYSGKAIISANTPPRSKNRVILMAEMQEGNGATVLFEQLLTQQLLQSGFKVRGLLKSPQHLSRSELSLGVLGSFVQDSSKSNSSPSIYEQSSEQLKKYCEEREADLIIPFGYWGAGESYVRVIDCETMNVEISATIMRPMTDIKYRIEASAHFLAKALEIAQDFAESQKKAGVFSRYYTIIGTMENFPNIAGSRDIEKVLYSKVIDRYKIEFYALRRDIYFSDARDDLY